MTLVSRATSSENPYRVKSVRADGHIKLVTLQRDGSSDRVLSTHRFALVGENNVVHVRDEIETRIWCANAEGEATIAVTPAFESLNKIHFAGKDIDVRVAEITTAAEFSDYQELEGFHYRGIDFSKIPEETTIKTKKGTGGRRAVLICQLRLSNKWVSVGYIEIQMPLMMAKPRHIAFDRPFSHPTRNVSWDGWKKGGSTLINLIARIARVVVHPEYRGMSLSHAMVSSSVLFVSERWHVAGQKALFLEISAEMLKHVDFVSGVGFSFLGYTEGNRERIVKDLRSVKDGAGGDSGIMSLQRKYYSTFQAYLDLKEDKFENVSAKLSEILSKDDPWDDMEPEEWLALRPIIRSPIPYYVKGLDEYSDGYVRAAAIKKPEPRATFCASGRTEITFRKFEIWSDYEIPLSPYTRMVMDGFGLTTKTIRTRLVGALNTSASPGSITFVAGASGVGKSLLLNALDPEFCEHGTFRRGKVEAPPYTAGWLRDLPLDIPIFQCLAEKYGPERTFDALSRVGLSEAMLFVKPFRLLSRGQRYRAMLADLMLRPDEVWLIDEFCSDLDPLSAKIVAHRLRLAVLKEQRTTFVAAANHGHFIGALRPTRVILLETGGRASILSWKEYSDGFLQ